MSTPSTANPMQIDATFFTSLEIRRTRALVDKDEQVLEELHSQNYQLITPSGRVFTRKRYLDMILNQPFYSDWQVGEITCRVSEGMAAIRYQATITFPSGKVMVCWHTDTYEKISGSWQAIWSQATEISP